MITRIATRAAMIGVLTLACTTPILAQDTVAATVQWPYPIADQARYSKWLFDLLEYQRVAAVDAARWDFVGWHGGDRRRLWLKSEGLLYAGGSGEGELDAQALYGMLVTPYFDLQAGVRAEQHREPNSKPARAFAVIGFQGLAPYRVDIEPLLFLSNRGKLSARFTAANDMLITQRVVLQTRMETEIAAQSDEAFGVPNGINDFEAGFRLRGEIRRELAPYVGVSYLTNVGITADRVRREGGVANAFIFATGVRTWF